MTQQSRPARPTPEPSPADIAVDIIKRELPGFEAAVSAATDRIMVRGPIFFGGWVGLDMLHAIPEDFAEEAVRHLIKETRRNAIAALGLETMIREREERARAEGYRDGKSDGIAVGTTEGRREMLAEIIAASDKVTDDE